MESLVNFNSIKEKKWFVIYTRPRWEKKLDRLLQMQGIESYCPVRYVENQWADRKKTVSLPLFNSYVFVHINECDQYKVRYVLGVLNFVYYMGKPAVIKDKIIEDIKIYVSKYKDIEVINVHEIEVGDRVRIKNGLFFNQEGKVIQVQEKNVLMIFDHLDCALVSKVPYSNLVLDNNQIHSDVK